MSSKVLYINNNGKQGSSTSKSDGETLGFSMHATKKNIFSQSLKPKKNGISTKPDSYEMTYNIDTKLSINSILKKIHKTLGIIDNTSDNPLANWTKSTKYYNRFKLPSTNDMLQKGFAHVFFVRPDCNVLTNSGKKLTSNLQGNQVFSLAMKNSPELVRELILSNGSNHDFMFSLSNKASSFSLSDEYINTDVYGKTFTGYKIAYGKNNIESKTAGNLSITFDDDRFFHIYQVHKLWVEYISGAYRGEIIPRENDIINKILDYCGACYYFITAEDNETILFWSKYYGLFPTQIPSEQFSWAKGNLITNPEITIQYMYSFKEDCNPLALVEFNKNARAYNGNLTYAPTYDKSLGHCGQTWVGSPYIELITNGNSTIMPYTFKLRFKRQ